MPHNSYMCLAWLQKQQQQPANAFCYQNTFNSKHKPCHSSLSFSLSLTLHSIIHFFLICIYHNIIQFTLFVLIIHTQAFGMWNGLSCILKFQMVSTLLVSPLRWNSEQKGWNWEIFVHSAISKWYFSLAMYTNMFSI